MRSVIIFIIVIVYKNNRPRWTASCGDYDLIIYNNKLNINIHVNTNYFYDSLNYSIFFLTIISGLN